MRYRIVSTIGLAFLLGLGVISFAQESRLQKPEVRTSGNIRYISGGLGKEERDLLQQMGKDYSLKLIFAAKQGDYLSTVRVAIKDSQDNTVLDTVAEGPWMYMTLPEGKYAVHAEAQGQMKQQAAQINKERQVALEFYW
jgi:hypothetical protein